MLLTILLLWCSGTFCGEVSKSVKEYSFEKHREEIIEDLRVDIRKNLHEICYAGHGIAVGGYVVDSGEFNWANGNFPTLSEPDPSYHGLVFTDSFGEDSPSGNVAYTTRIRARLLRDLGATLAPVHSFIFLQGLETLTLRVKKHSENALIVAKHLENHPKVSWVNYPGLESHPAHENAHKYLGDSYGGILGFGIKGGLEAGKQ